METITHPTLVQLVAAGAVRVVIAVGQPGGWTLLVRYGLAERALAAQRSKQLRVFRKLDTLVLYLQQIGVCRFEVDATGFMGAPETDQELLNIKGVISIKKSPHSGLQS
ncbi:hypothetical protein QCL02_003315 [Shigella dysenteriae]|nr:hypothetical protein [Shigella dysenteriae]EKS7450329.1 hypothetical protein [Shigella dysenteriae]